MQPSLPVRPLTPRRVRLWSLCIVWAPALTQVMASGVCFLD